MVLLGICYIFGAAEGLPEKFEKKSDDIVIAADGGYRFLKENSIVPDIVHSIAVTAYWRVCIQIE